MLLDGRFCGCRRRARLPAGVRGRDDFRAGVGKGAGRNPRRTLNRKRFGARHGTVSARCVFTAPCLADGNGLSAE